MKNIAIIGTSSAAITHIDSYHDMNDVNIKWIFSEDIKRAEVFKNKYKIYKSTSKYDQILEDEEINYIDICNIPSKHIEYAESAIESGKGLIIEKPISQDLSKAKKFYNKYKKSKSPIMIVYQYPYSETFQKLKEIINSKQFGDLMSYYVRYFTKRDKTYYKNKWRTQKGFAGGGVLINQGIHFINLIFSYIGYSKMKLFARTTNIKHKIDVEDTCLINIVHDNGILGSFNFSTGLNSDMEIRLYFEKALVLTKVGKVIIHSYKDIMKTIDTPKKGTFKMLAQNFFQNTKKISDYKMNFHEAVMDLEIIDLAYNSAQKEKLVNFF